MVLNNIPYPGSSRDILLIPLCDSGNSLREGYTIQFLIKLKNVMQFVQYGTIQPGNQSYSSILTFILKIVPSMCVLSLLRIMALLYGNGIMIAFVLLLDNIEKVCGTIILLCTQCLIRTLFFLSSSRPHSEALEYTNENFVETTIMMEIKQFLISVCIKSMNFK